MDLNREFWWILWLRWCLSVSRWHLCSGGGRGTQPELLAESPGSCGSCRHPTAGATGRCLALDGVGYPLVISHSYYIWWFSSWIYPLIAWWFSIVTLVYQRVCHGFWWSLEVVLLVKTLGVHQPTWRPDRPEHHSFCECDRQQELRDNTNKRIWGYRGCRTKHMIEYRCVTSWFRMI